MKKYTLFILLLGSIFITQNLSAQKDYAPGKIDWGIEHKSPYNSRLSKIIGTNSKGFYSLRVYNSGMAGGHPKYLIEQFNKKNKIIKSKELEMKYKKKRREFEGITLLNNKLFLFTSFYNTKMKTKYLFAETLTSTLKQKNDLKMIGEIEDNKTRRGKFNYELSMDSSKVMVYHKIPNSRNKEEQFAFTVFDDNFNELWKKDITLPYLNKRFFVKNYLVDNEGNAYILGRIELDRQEAKKEKIINEISLSRQRVYRYTLLAYKDNGETFKEYHIDLEGKMITDLTIEINDDGDLICAGFFSEQHLNRQRGVCFIKIDAESGEVITSNVKDFDFDFLTENFSEFRKSIAKNAEVKEKTWRQAEFNNFNLDELILRSDGGAVLIAEQFFVQQYETRPIDNQYDRSYSDRMMRTITEYNYNDIIVVNINPDGTIEWTSRIPKRQLTRDDGGYFSSYSMAVVRDRMYFVYNDNSRNFGVSKENRRVPYRFNGKKSLNGRNSVITLSEITQSGEVKKYVLGKNKDEKILTRPKVCEQTGLYEMVVYGERNGKFKFGNLKFVPQ